MISLPPLGSRGVIPTVLPMLSPDQFCGGRYGFGSRRCLRGWVIYICGDNHQSRRLLYGMIKTVIRDHGFRGKKFQRIKYANDRLSPNQLAAVWAEVRTRTTNLIFLRGGIV